MLPSISSIATKWTPAAHGLAHVAKIARSVIVRVGGKEDANRQVPHHGAAHSAM
jgi:hypothetical protein